MSEGFDLQIPKQEETEKTESMQTTWGSMPGGQILKVHVLDPMDFGAIGATGIRKINAMLKKERKSSFMQTEQMLKAFRLLQKWEQIQTISLGSNRLGQEVLVITTIVKESR